MKATILGACDELSEKTGIPYSCHHLEGRSYVVYRYDSDVDGDVEIVSGHSNYVEGYMQALLDAEFRR